MPSHERSRIDLSNTRSPTCSSNVEQTWVRLNDVPRKRRLSVHIGSKAWSFCAYVDSVYRLQARHIAGNVIEHHPDSSTAIQSAARKWRSKSVAAHHLRP